jgi:uncharacterized protein
MHELELAEWRREVARLYADVRALAAVDPIAAHELWRSVREQLYRMHPQSPVPAAVREMFRARHFPYDPACRFEAVVRQADAPRRLTGVPEAQPRLSPPLPSPLLRSPLLPSPLLMVALPNSGDTASGAQAALRFHRIGTVALPFHGGERILAVFWLDDYAGGLFLPFGDATNGRETYGAGRYLLDAAKGADLGGDVEAGTLVLDFNFAYQPSCAFDPRWACPLAPPENRLDIAIAAGERLA